MRFSELRPRYGWKIIPCPECGAPFRSDRSVQTSSGLWCEDIFIFTYRSPRGQQLVAVTCSTANCDRPHVAQCQGPSSHEFYIRDIIHVMVDGLPGVPR